MKKGIRNLVGEVEDALYRLGCGGVLEETQVEEILDPKTGEIKQIKRKKMTKMLRPDLRALTFWLTNRAPKRWQNKPPLPENEEPCAMPEWEDDEEWGNRDEEAGGK